MDLKEKQHIQSSYHPSLHHVRIPSYTGVRQPWLASAMNGVEHLGVNRRIVYLLYKALVRAIKL